MYHLKYIPTLIYGLNHFLNKKLSKHFYINCNLNKSRISLIRNLTLSNSTLRDVLKYWLGLVNHSKIDKQRVAPMKLWPGHCFYKRISTLEVSVKSIRACLYQKSQLPVMHYQYMNLVFLKSNSCTIVFV